MFGFGKGKKSKEKTKAELIAEAQANARKAREVLGQETIDNIASQLEEHNPFEALVPELAEKNREQRELAEARNFLENMDKAELVDHLRAIIDEDRLR